MRSIVHLLLILPFIKFVDFGDQFTHSLPENVLPYKFKSCTTADDSGLSLAFNEKDPKESAFVITSAEGDPSDNLRTYR
ncbi:MAG: hypothetical protein LBP35_01035 [Candidatus Ancillula trichonymphae]|nr:hypothetical protein [Candidatus Ancillula trichonymphae]